MRSQGMYPPYPALLTGWCLWFDGAHNRANARRVQCDMY